MSETVIKIESLSAGYGDKEVVRNVSFTVRSGEIVTLIGPNGAGKSTLLRTVARQLAPLRGTVYLNGTDVKTIDSNEFAKELSILTTDRVRPALLTVRDVVSLGRCPYTGTLGLLTADDRRVVEQTMERVGVTALARREFGTLSDGQRQRVMLARAVCQEPRALVLDEPTSYLDIRYQLELLTLLRELARERGLAVVLSLHELELARRVSDKLVCVKDGIVDRVGAPTEIFIDRYIEELYQMPAGSYAAFFGGAENATEESGAFFRNRACKSFPCHEGVDRESFNCLFCYCPLYALGDRCGGNFRYTDKGVKSCVDCAFPHLRDNYAAVLARFPELAALTRERKGGNGV